MDIPIRQRLRLELRDFQLLEAIGRRKSLTKAALDLSLTQSALSHQLRRLEATFGAKLFDRAGKSMAPTALGWRLIEDGSEILDRTEHLERLHLDSGASAARSFKITASCSTYYTWLAQALGEFTAARQDVNIAIEHIARPKEFTALKRGEVDFIISSYPPHGVGFVAEDLFSIEVIALVSERHRLAARIESNRGIKWTDLLDDTVLIHDLPQSDELALRRAAQGLDETSQPDSSRPNIQRINLTEAIIELARKGQGVGLVGKWISHTPFDTDGLLVVSPTPRYRRRILAVWRKEREPDLPLLELTRFLRAAGEPMALRRRGGVRTVRRSHLRLERGGMSGRKN